MWILRWVLIAVVMLIVLGFSLQNSGEVPVHFLKWKWDAIPFYLVVYFSFAAGMVAFIMVAVYHQLRQQMRMHKCHSEIKRLKATVEELTAALEEASESDSADSANRSVEFDDEDPDSEVPVA